jgi:hypothetical protein
MATENAAQEYTAAEEEEAILKNWQSDGCSSYGSYHRTQTLIREEGGLGRVQMIVTSIIFLSRKSYGNPKCCSSFNHTELSKARKAFKRACGFQVTDNISITIQDWWLVPEITREQLWSNIKEKIKFSDG